MTNPAAPSFAPPPPPRFVESPALTLAGFSVRYRPETRASIPAQWGRFGAEVGQVPEPKGPADFGLCSEWRGDEMEYTCAVQAAPGARLPAGWRLLTLPAQRYAVFAHQGHVSELWRTLCWVLQDWLPGSGRTRTQGFAGELEILERYGPGFDPRTGLGDIEAWLPVDR